MNRETKRQLGSLSDVEQRLIDPDNVRRRKKKQSQSDEVDVYGKNGKLTLDKETRKSINNRLMSSLLLSIVVALPAAILLFKYAYGSIVGGKWAIVISLVFATLFSQAAFVSFSRVAAFLSFIPSKSTWESYALPLVLNQLQRMYATIKKSQSEENAAKQRASEATTALRRLQKEYESYRSSEQKKDPEKLRQAVAELTSKLADSERRALKWQRCAEYATAALDSPVTKQDKEVEEVNKPVHKPVQVTLQDEKIAREQEVLDWLDTLDSENRTVYIFGPRSRWMFRVYAEFSRRVDDVVWIESGTKKFPLITSNDVVFIFSNMVFHAETDALMNIVKQLGAFYWSSGTSSFSGFIQHLAREGVIPNNSVM